MSLSNNIHQTGLRADQPAAGPNYNGVLYCVEDEGHIVERCNGSSWEAYSPDAVVVITDHGDLSGLGDDDHTQYLLADGTRALTGDQSLGSHKLTNVANPASAQDAATKDYVDDGDAAVASAAAGYTDMVAAGVAAGVVTDHGGLTGLGDDDHSQYLLTSGARALTGDQSAGGHKLTNVADPASAQDAATKASVDALLVDYTKKDGSVAFTGAQSMGSHKLTDVTDPTAAQDAATKAYVDETVSTATPPPSSGGPAAAYVANGGQVIWESGYTYRVSAADYYIGGVLYNSDEDTVTLDAADGTDDRIDVIVLDSAGNVDKVTGVASPNPSEPSIDPGTQVKVGLVSVPALSSAPSTTTELVYAEATGGPGEWNGTASAGSIVVNSTNNPRGGTKDVEGTNVPAAVHVDFAKPSGTLDPNLYAYLALYVRSKATWANNRGFYVSLRSSGVLVGAAVQIKRTGTFGFDSSITSGYQQLAIPITAFAVPGGSVINGVRIEGYGGAVGWYVDDIQFQGSAVAPTTGGISQAEADARYAALVHASRHSSGAADPISHNNLAGLTTGDPHTQYILVAGTRAFTGDQSMGSHKLTNVTDPSSAQDAATKAYVDSVTLTRKFAAARVATTGDITIATGLNNGDTIDGVTLATGDLVLVKSQSAPEQNGLYLVGASPARDTLFDSYDEHPGAVVTVQEGTANADTLWLCTSNAGGTLNSTALAFSQLSVTAGISQLTGHVTAGPGSGSQTTTIANAVVTPAMQTTAGKTHQLTFTIDGGGSVIATGQKTLNVPCPIAGTITEWTILGVGGAGAIVIDVYRCTYSDFDPGTHPVSGDSIVGGGTKPTVTASAKKAQSAPSSWTSTTVAAGDIFDANVISVSTFTKVVLAMTVVGS